MLINAFATEKVTHFEIGTAALKKIKSVLIKVIAQPTLVPDQELPT